MKHWMNEEAEFVMRNRIVLASRPVWLFSSVPLSIEAKDPQGRDLCVVSEPKEIAEFYSHTLFFIFGLLYVAMLTRDPL
jgi:menaquinone-dependent protoporphyrinogen oxidase